MQWEMKRPFASAVKRNCALCYSNKRFYIFQVHIIDVRIFSPLQINERNRMIFTCSYNEEVSGGTFLLIVYVGTKSEKKGMRFSFLCLHQGQKGKNRDGGYAIFPFPDGKQCVIDISFHRVVFKKAVREYELMQKLIGYGVLGYRLRSFSNNEFSQSTRQRNRTEV